MFNFTRSERNQGKIKITVTTIAALVFINASLFSQAPLKQWDARFGGSSSDYLFSVQQTTDGGYILGGHSWSGMGGDKTQENFSAGQYVYADYWIVKTDAIGVKKWDASFGGSIVEYFSSVQQTIDGGYILGGSSHSSISGNKTQASKGGFDYWIVKIDSNGLKQWEASFGGSEDDFLASVCQTTDGGYILGGSSSSDVSGDKTQASQGEQDYWIIKTDINGVKQWDARFGGNSYDLLHSIERTVEGGYIIGGSSYSGISGDKTQENQGGSDYWILKTDANGVKQWDARFGGIDDEYFSLIQQTTDDGYILGGTSNSGIGGDKTQASQGEGDYWIIKTDVNGLKQWDKRFGGTEYESLSSLLQTANGEYLLGGYSRSGISGDKTEENYSTGYSYSDYWVVKIDAFGVMKWDASFGGSDEDRFTSLENTTDGGYILGGYSSSGISGDKTQASQGSADYWIVKTTPIYTIPESPSISFYLYPNPAKDHVTLNCSLLQTSQVCIKVDDVSGREIVTFFDHVLESGYHSLQFNTDHLAIGVYVVSIISDLGVSSEKLIIR